MDLHIVNKINLNQFQRILNTKKTNQKNILS